MFQTTQTEAFNSTDFPFICYHLNLNNKGTRVVLPFEKSETMVLLGMNWLI